MYVSCHERQCGRKNNANINAKLNATGNTNKTMMYIDVQ